MGARHPQAVLKQLNANKNDFILAATFLVRTGVCKRPGDAIRYMEEHNISVEEIIEKIILSQQTKLIVEDPEKEDEE